MNPRFQQMLHEATRLTQSGRLHEATRMIQQALHGEMPNAGGPVPMKAPMTAPVALPPVRAPQIAPDFVAGPAAHPTAVSRGASVQFAGRTLEYKVHVPGGLSGRALPLVVMLHGCTQNPDDFARGTAMNEHADREGFVVAYPAQSASANPSACWNWFKHNHQRRGRGEPALIAALARQVMLEQPIDPQRVYIAGLSAGGAMAALVGSAYPDLFAAVGVHSGIAPGAATNLTEAMSVMKGGADAGALGPGGGGVSPARSPIGLPLPTIVFHGDRDRTVHPGNGHQVIAAALSARGLDAPGRMELRSEEARSAAGRQYTRTVHSDETGQVLGEHWLIHGAGHAWSGGRSGGSYTDPNGPDASREMLRFFLEHPRGADR